MLMGKKNDPEALLAAIRIRNIVGRRPVFSGKMFRKAWERWNFLLALLQFRVILSNSNDDGTLANTCATQIDNRWRLSIQNLVFGALETYMRIMQKYAVISAQISGIALAAIVSYGIFHFFSSVGSFTSLASSFPLSFHEWVKDVFDNFSSVVALLALPVFLLMAAGSLTVIYCARKAEIVCGRAVELIYAARAAKDSAIA